MEVIWDRQLQWKKSYFLCVHDFLFTFLFHYAFFLTYLLPDLSIDSFQNRPIPFACWRSWEATKPGFNFFGLFYVVVYFVMDVCLHVCFCCICFSFFSTKPRDWLGRTSPKWPILWRVGRKSLTQSVVLTNRVKLNLLIIFAFWINLSV